MAKRKVQNIPLSVDQYNCLCFVLRYYLLGDGGIKRQYGVDISELLDYMDGFSNKYDFHDLFESLNKEL